MARLTDAQRRVLGEVLEELARSPWLLRRFVPEDIYPGRNNVEIGRRRVLMRLTGMGYFTWVNQGMPGAYMKPGPLFDEAAEEFGVALKETQHDG